MSPVCVLFKQNEENKKKNKRAALKAQMDLEEARKAASQTTEQQNNNNASPQDHEGKSKRIHERKNLIHFISSYFPLQQMRKKARAAVVRGCIMVRTDATLLLLLLLHHSLETKNFQLPEPPFPGSITMETTGLKGTCPVSRDKVNPGFTGCRACRGTEGVRKPLYILQALYRDCTREQ